MIPAATDKVILMHAVFDGDQQVTAWRRNRQQTIAALRRAQRAGGLKHKTYTLRSQNFISRSAS
jgi:hypothetical protein